jgi:hypothetical protein
MKKVDNSRKLFIAAIVIGVIFLLGICVIPTVFIMNYESDQNNRFEAFQSIQLPNDIVERWCREQVIPNSIADCSDTTTQILLEYRHIREIFRQNLTASSTHEEVKHIFGIFEDMCFYLDEEYSCEYNIRSYRFSVVYDNSTHIVIKALFPSSGS